jgi:hypothetical protein
MTIQRIMIGGFLVLALAFAILIFKLLKQDKNEWMAKSTQSKVVEIYEGYKGKPNYQIMKLSDDQRFTIPQFMLGKLRIGDSVFKEKGSDFYRFKLIKTLEEFQAGWQ